MSSGAGKSTFKLSKTARKALQQHLGPFLVGKETKDFVRQIFHSSKELKKHEIVMAKVLECCGNAFEYMAKSQSDTPVKRKTIKEKQHEAVKLYVTVYNFLYGVKDFAGLVTCRDGVWSGFKKRNSRYPVAFTSEQTFERSYCTLSLWASLAAVKNACQFLSCTDGSVKLLPYLEPVKENLEKAFESNANVTHDTFNYEALVDAIDLCGK